MSAGYVILALVSLGLYFLPTIVAFSNDKKNKTAICVLNIFGGLTGIGWIGALIWSFVRD